MGSTPETVNAPANLADEILRGLFAVALPLAKAAEVAAVPWLGSWPISQIFDALQNWIADSIRVQLSKRATFIIIDFQTVQERDNFIEASARLRARLDLGGSNDAESKAYDEALARLVHWDGSFTP